MVPATLMKSVLCLTSGFIAQPRDDAAVEIKTTHVAGPIYMLEGRGGNIGVSAGPDGILIVDDQFAPLAGKIRAALDKLSDGNLEFVLNTHWHGDHTGGNVEFGPEAPIIAHTNVRVLFTGSNVVRMGDHLFAGRFPFVDLEHGGDVEGLAENVGKVIAQLAPDVRVIPGHGPLSTLDDLKAYHRMLVETIAAVRKRRAGGQSLEHIQSEGLSDQWASWGTGFIDEKRWIEFAFRSLDRKKDF